MQPSDAEAFPAPAFAGDVGVSEAKCFVEAFLDEIDLRAVDQPEALAIHDHLDATLIEDYVIVVQLIGIVDDVGKPVAAGRSDANA